MRFIDALTSTARAIDPARSIGGVDTRTTAPMESICAQIDALKVDSSQRCIAIEREQRERRERLLFKITTPPYKTLFQR